MGGTEFPVTLLDLAGTIALLLWGVRMVQTGIQRAFGARPAHDPRRRAANAHQGIPDRHRRDRHPAEQHGNRPDGFGIRGGRPRGPGAGARRHARRQCRHDADRATPVARPGRRHTGADPAGRADVPPRPGYADARPGAGGDRAGPDADGAAPTAGSGHAVRGRAEPAPAARGGHAAAAGRDHRRRVDLGGTFQRGGRAAGDVPRSQGRGAAPTPPSRSCWAPISAPR